MDKIFAAKLFKHLKEICLNCGFPKESHNTVGYYSKHYKKYIPLDCCPGHEGKIDWSKEPGTVFKPSGKYK